MKDTEPEVCPVCNGTSLIMESGEFEGSYYVTPWYCSCCKTYGRQMEEVAFDGHVVDVDSIAIPDKLITAGI